LSFLARSLLVPLFSTCLGCIGTAGTIGFLRSHRNTGPDLPLTETVLTVNGQSVPSQQFEDELKLTAASQTLQRLMQQMVIEQEALKKKVTLSEPEEAQISFATRHEPFQLRALAQRQARGQVLLRSLLLQDVSEAEKRKVFAQFGHF